MAVSWTSEGAGFHAAECRLGTGLVVHLLVEELGDRGWDWQVWEPTRCLRADCGVADTLEAAKARAELAASGAVAYAEAVLAEILGRLRQGV